MPTIIVIVQKGTTVAESFRQILFPKGTAVVLEVYSRLRGHIGKFDWTRRSWQRGTGLGEAAWFATSAEGSVTGVADCLHAEIKDKKTNTVDNMIDFCCIDIQISP